MAKWIQKAVSKKGALRRTLKLKKNEKLTQSKINKALKKKNISLKTKKRLVLARTLLKLAQKRKKRKR